MDQKQTTDLQTRAEMVMKAFACWSLSCARCLYVLFATGH